MRRLLACVLFLAAATAFGTDRYVATGSGSGCSSTVGWISGTGTSSCRWTLGVALNGGAGGVTVQPGDRILLAAGTYLGPFTVSLSGTAASPITIMSESGSARATHAVIDGKNGNGAQPAVFFTAGTGHDVILRDLEITNSLTPRPLTQFTRPTGIDVRQTGIKIINCVVHDNGGGIYGQTASTTVESTGNVDYYNGTSSLDHGFYMQNSTKTWNDNIIFYNMSRGIQTSGGSGSDGYSLSENMLWGNGQLNGCCSGQQVTMSGGPVLTNLTVTNNDVWSNTSSAAFNLGGQDQGEGPGSNFTVTGNYVVSSVSITENGGSTVTGNSFLNQVNVWYPSPESAFQTKYPSNTFGTAEPGSGKHIDVRCNPYESGRANIYVFNYDLSSTISADVSACLTVGATYEVVNAADYYGTAVASGTYGGGSLTLTVSGLSMSAPVGISTPTNRWPKIGALVLLTTGGSATPTPTNTATFTPTPNATNTPTFTPTPTYTLTNTPTAGTTPTNSPTPTLTPVPGSCTWVQAEAGTIAAPASIGTDPLASGSEYVSSPTTNSGTDTFSFQLGPGTYYMNHRVLAPDGNSDSLFTSLDGESDTTRIDDLAEQLWSPDWQITRMVDRSIPGCSTPLAGNPASCQRALVIADSNVHTLALRWRDPNGKVDWIAFCPDSNLAGDFPAGPTNTPTITNTPTNTATPTASNTPTPSATPPTPSTPTFTPTPSNTATNTATNTPTYTRTNTPTVTPTVTLGGPTLTPTMTPTANSTPKPPKWCICHGVVIRCRLNNGQKYKCP